MPINAGAPELEALLAGAKYAMGAPAVPQVLITIAARFGRVSWKYSSVAYSLILKDVGVLTQTLYIMATDMGLGGCAIGLTNIDLFAKMTGIEFHVEGPVGQFAFGRGAPHTPNNLRLSALPRPSPVPRVGRIARCSAFEISDRLVLARSHQCEHGTLRVGALDDPVGA